MEISPTKVVRQRASLAAAILTAALLVAPAASHADSLYVGIAGQSNDREV